MRQAQKNKIKSNIDNPTEPVEENDTKVIVSLPDKIEVVLVQGNELRHYEIFLWLAGLFATIAAGFWTAYFTLPQEQGINISGLLWSAVAFTAATFLFIGVAVYYRRKVYRGSIKKEVSLRVFK